MTAVTYPKPGVNFTQPEWRRYHRLDTGVIGSPGGSDRQVYADGSGPYIKRLPGARKIQGIYGADDSTWQGTVSSNGTAQWRIDRVVDQLGADGVITTVIVAGTAAATPTPPDLEQTEGGVWQEHLAYFRVKPGFTNIVSTDAAVIDERRFMSVRVFPVSSDAYLPAAATIGDEATYPDSSRKRWTGSAWVPVRSLPDVFTFDDLSIYSSMVPPTLIASSLLGSLTISSPCRLLVRASCLVGFDTTGGSWQAGAGIRLVNGATGITTIASRGLRSVSPGAYAFTAEKVSDVIPAATYSVYGVVQPTSRGSDGGGIAFVNPQYTVMPVAL